MKTKHITLCFWGMSLAAFLLHAGVVPIGTEHAMVSGSGGHQSQPEVVMWPEGGLVVWENSGSTGTKRIDLSTSSSSPGLFPAFTDRR